ncbi:MAG: Yip1 family protein [Betaproteobacteria bacterium]
MPSLRRIYNLFLRPRAEWERIDAENTTVDSLLLRYILPLAALAPIATTFGMRTFDREWDPLHGFLVPAEGIFAAGATTYFASIGSIFALAGIFTLLAPMFGCTRDFVRALKVATYGSIPVLLAGATLVLPVMAAVGVVALCHTLYLLWMGADRVLHVPDGDRAEFVGISLVLLAFVSVLAGAAASSIGLI